MLLTTKSHVLGTEGQTRVRSQISREALTIISVEITRTSSLANRCHPLSDRKRIADGDRSDPLTVLHIFCV
jgi:hypothetical protein